MASTTRRTYTLAEVSKHNTKDDIWVTIHGNVYDISTYLDEHPGGRDVLLEVAGTDATDNFNYVGHSSTAEDNLRGFDVGDQLDYAKAVRRNFTIPAEQISRSSSLKAMSFHHYFLENIVAALGLTIVLLATGVFYLQRCLQEHEILPVRLSNAGGMGSVWVAMFLAFTFWLIVFGYFFLEFQKTLVHHKDIREYEPYFRCRPRFLAGAL